MCMCAIFWQLQVDFLWWYWTHISSSIENENNFEQFFNQDLVQKSIIKSPLSLSHTLVLLLRSTTRQYDSIAITAWLNKYSEYMHITRKKRPWFQTLVRRMMIMMRMMKQASDPTSLVFSWIGLKRGETKSKFSQIVYFYVYRYVCMLKASFPQSSSLANNNTNLRKTVSNWCQTKCSTYPPL